jgi:hypothetical protein
LRRAKHCEFSGNRGRFLTFTPLLRHFLALFAPSCPLWARFSPDHIQITQGKQHIELGVVLGQALVAGLLVFEDVLDDVKRVLWALSFS